MKMRNEISRRRGGRGTKIEGGSPDEVHEPNSTRDHSRFIPKLYLSSQHDLVRKEGRESQQTVARSSQKGAFTHVLEKHGDSKSYQNDKAEDMAVLSKSICRVNEST